MTLVHINRARYSRTECVVLHCPTCDRMRRMSAQFQEWYGWTLYCSGCGENWQDGEQADRPFVPGWRKRGRDHARSVLASIGIQA